MAGKITSIGGTSGKGGNFQSRPNPFGNGKSIGVAPKLNGSASIGIVLDEVLASGCAIMLGHTRDGGALVCTVLDGEERHRSYASNIQELDEMMLALHNYYGKSA
jgi:hypothetical protein